jgi:hypothetical protein
MAYHNRGDSVLSRRGGSAGNPVAPP